MLKQTSSLAVQKALSCLAQRQEAIAGNLANAETPGYRPRAVDFEQALQSAIDREKESGSAQPGGHISNVRPHVRYQGHPSGLPEASALERELTDLAETALQHEALVRVLSKQMKMLRTAITGGGAS